MKLTILIFISSFFLCHCGVKSPPLPPLKSAVSTPKEDSFPIRKIEKSGSKDKKKQKKNKKGDPSALPKADLT